MFLRILRHASLPRPTTQFRVVGPDGLIGRVDFIYEQLARGCRGDRSEGPRVRRRNVRRDAQRRNELIDQGLRVYEYTRGDVDDRPEWVAMTMRQRLRTSA